MSTSKASILRLQDIGKYYGDHIVLSGINFELHEHEIICLLGPSGCGKTTTLLMIAGIIKPDAGRIWIRGEEVAGPHRFVPPEKRHVGFVFQDYALFPHLNVERNVSFGINGTRTHRRLRARQELSRFDMTASAKLYPHMLSGGQRQRIALARALATDPVILLLDEPFASLDRYWRENLREETVDILRRRGSACVFVTHDPEEACAVGDRIILIDKGRPLQEGTAEMLYANPNSMEAVKFFGKVNVVQGVVLQGQVRCGAISIHTPHFMEGDKVDVAIRPEAFVEEPKEGMVKVDSYIRSIRFMGKGSQISFAIDGLDQLLTAHISRNIAHEAGSAYSLYLDLSRVHVFPAEAD